jgi:hypothetical protein
MINASPGFELELIWFDDHMLEFRATASNDHFFGETTFYAALDEAKTFASAIAGFPTTINDSREYEFGGIELPGYGGVKLRFSCRDELGHLAITISIQACSLFEGQPLESSMLVLHSDPASIDTFVQELRRIQLRAGEKARLSPAT